MCEENYRGAALAGGETFRFTIALFESFFLFVFVMSKSKRSKICKTLSKPSCDVKDMLLQYNPNVLYQKNRAKKHEKKLAKKAKRDAKKC